jgi:hypothetical protein
MTTLPDVYGMQGTGYLQHHVITIVLLSYHRDHSSLPNEIHRGQIVLSEILHASNEGGLAVIETIHCLRTRLDVRLIT